MHMADNNKHQVQFKSTFDGNVKNTIRYIFDIGRYEQIANFQSPESLFINVYNTLPSFIQNKLSADKLSVLSKQHANLNDDATEEARAQAAIYTTLSMQKFFIQHYRPRITRGAIFRQLLSIRMRLNENPRQTMDRIATAIDYAYQTIELLNAADTSIPIAALQPTDITEVLNTIFCIKNYSDAENNRGGINKLVRDAWRERQGKLSFTAIQKFKPYYEIIDQIVSKCTGALYAGDKDFILQHYDPISLPMWETPAVKRTPTPTRPTKPDTPKGTPNTRKRKRKHDTPRSPYSPSTKRRRYTSTTTTDSDPNPTPKSHTDTTCFRCGKIGHHAKTCYSKRDINNTFLKQTDRRKLSQMPYRGDYKSPKQPNNSQPNTPTNPHSFKTRSHQKWGRYPNNNNPTQLQQQYQPNSSHVKPISNPSNPQLTTLISQVQQMATADTHIDPQILQSIQSLHSLINNSNNSNNSQSGHYPQS